MGIRFFFSEKRKNKKININDCSTMLLSVVIIHSSVLLRTITLKQNPADSQNLSTSFTWLTTFSPFVISISPSQPMYASKLNDYCQSRGFDSPVYDVYAAEKEGPDQTHLLSATVTVKRLTFPTPWIWCKSPEEAHDCAAKVALEFFTGGRVSTTSSVPALPSSSPPSDCTPSALEFFTGRGVSRLSTSRDTVLPLCQPPATTLSGVPDVHMYKNKLQEYTQKTLLQLPIYHTVNEGPQHKPKFRCTVTVQNTPYTSPQTFTQRKSAEQDAARIALESLQQYPKEEICLADVAFCKSILNEYAVKMQLDMPSYETVQREGSLSVFECTVHFHGVYYTGVKGKNKKEAEQKAACFVIRIILDTGASDSESVKIMSGIIRSKFKFYSALTNTKDTGSIFSRIVDTSDCKLLPSDTVKKEAAYPPFHLFKKPRLGVPSQAIVPSIELVPSGSVLALVAPPSGPKREAQL